MLLQAIHLGYRVLRGSFIEPSPMVSLQVFALAVLRPGDTALDVGANLGFIAGPLARAVGPQGTVLSFEPNPLARRILERSLQRARLDQVRVFPVAVSAQAGSATLQTGWLSFGESGTLEAPLQNRQRLGRWRKSYTVQCIRLDSWLSNGRLSYEANSWPLPRLVKIDTEGHEFSVLQGAERLIAEARPALILEYGVDFDGGRPAYPNWLRQREFSLYDAANFQPYDQASERATSPGYLTDLIAIPAERADWAERMAHLATLGWERYSHRPSR